MRLISFNHRGRAGIGVMSTDTTIIDLAKAAPSLPTSMRALLAMGEQWRERVEEAVAGKAADLSVAARRRVGFFCVRCCRDGAEPMIPRSHDNIYSTVLGMLKIATAEYKPELDVFAACDRGVKAGRADAGSDVQVK